MARTRVFDIDRAIETATELFWRHGYERTSLAELTEAMGITPPSFYFAFGSKEGLFRKVLEHYLKTRLSYAEEALKQPTARDVAKQMLSRLADLYTDPAYPRGCPAVNCALPCSDDADPVRRVLRRFVKSARRDYENGFGKPRPVAICQRIWSQMNSRVCPGCGAGNGARCTIRRYS